MNNCYGKILLLISCAVFISASAFAGNGKISGTVRDASTREPVPGINVTIVGTKFGGTVDPEGRYYILNLPPGEYSVRAAGVGYAGKTIANVIVRADQTTQLDFSIASETVQIGEVLVQAEQRVVDKSQTASKLMISKDELNNKLPTTTAIEVLNTTPGAYRGFIRGGRITETKTIVDGVDVTDQYYAIASEQTNQSILNATAYVTRSNDASLSTNSKVNFSAVEQLSVSTGATGAENSSATAGLINYALKEGRGKWTGALMARSSQVNGLEYKGPNVYWNSKVYTDEKALIGRRLDSMRAMTVKPQANITKDSIKYSRMTWAPDKYNSQEKPQIELEGSIGGGITEDWGLFFSGRYSDSHGRLPNERTRLADLTLKTTYNITPELRLNAFGIMNDRGRILGWKNSVYNDNALYFLEGVPRNDGTSIVGSLKATYLLSKSTFFELQGSQTYRDDRYGYTDGNGDGIASLNEDGDFITMETADEVNKYIAQASRDYNRFFRIGNEDESFLATRVGVGNVAQLLARPQFYYENTSNITNTVKFDLTSQIDFNNQIKAGAQYRMTEIDKIERNSTLGADATDSRRRLLVEKWNFKPTEFGAYISDKMEYAGLVINLGVRVDNWNPKVADFANYFNLIKRDTVAIDDSLRADWVPIRSGSDVPSKWYVSPRIGVSHPISDEAAMYFSYSRNSIPPPYSRLYSAYNSTFGAAGSIPNFQSLQQDLTRSSNYEIGAQWEFVPQEFGMSFTAYMRDIENYSPTAVTLALANGTNVMYFNGQYADSRGVEITISALRKNYFDFMDVSGRMSYAYTYIKASGWTGTDPAQPTSFSRADTLVYGTTLPFNDFKYYNKVQNNVTGTSSTLTGGYDRTHRVSYVLMVGFPYDLQLTSVGTFQSGFYYPLQYTADPRVAARELGTAPWNKQVDIRLEKGFMLGTVRAAVFFDVKNLFNWTNIIGYDNTVTGAALWEYSNSGSTALNDGNPDPTGTWHRTVGPDGSMFYDIPREYYFGVKLDF